MSFDERKSILLVDDDPINLQILSGMLSPKYEIKNAQSGDEALQIVGDGGIDLMLLDVEMPELSGYDVCKKLKSNQDTKGIPVIFVTARDDDADEETGFKVGAVDYIKKPFKMATITARVETQLRLRAQELELLMFNKSLMDIVEKELAIRVKLEVEKKTQEAMLAQTSKLALMGEMIDSIAHQWKQPINALSIYIGMLEDDFDEGFVDKAYMTKFHGDIQKQLLHMTSTLSEFRTFFKPDKHREKFSVKSAIDSVLVLIKDEFIKNQIEIVLEFKDDFIIDGFINEFKHLIINILNNAKDAYIERNLKSRVVEFKIFSDEKYHYLEIIDRAGGIPDEVLPNIFKANFTTKSEGKGSGIGLYMSSQIALKHQGELSAQNVENGAKFIFKKQKCEYIG